jgi:hypothetical protein
MTDPLFRLFAETLHVDPDELNDQSSPDAVSEWDSLAAVKLVKTIEERFHPASEYRRDVLGLILSFKRFAVNGEIL